MTIVSIKDDDVTAFSVVTTPTRYYASSSTGGVTGSVHLYTHRSTIEKELHPLDAFIDLTHDDANIEAMIEDIQSAVKVDPTINFSSRMQEYLTKVHQQSSSARLAQTHDVIRFTPSVSFTSNTARKLIVKNILNAYYRVVYPSAQWAYTNYNSLNFFTSSTVPESTALLYPMQPSPVEHIDHVTGTYIPSGAFSFDFYINAHHATNRAGTILHVSSTYALSLVPGSYLDANGQAEAFRLMLQLSHSADVPPSRAMSLAGSGYPNDLIFLSNNNSIKKDNWHHVIVRWGTKFINDGTGSFVIDGVESGQFSLPSGTIAPLEYASPQGDPDILVVGNYYEGKNTGNDAQALFFATSPAKRDGLAELVGAIESIDEPADYWLRHPLNAELHDVAIRRRYLTDTEITISGNKAPESLDNSFAFYLPPFFVQSSSFRQYVFGHGGIMQTPFFEVDGTTDDPFNIALSFGVNGHYINLENFVKDFASHTFPRILDLTGSTIDHTTEARPANEFLYDQMSVRKRNLTLLPCDDGNFIPGWELLQNETRATKLVDDLGNQDLSLIHIDNMVNEKSLLFGTEFTDIFNTSYDNAVAQAAWATGTTSLDEKSTQFINELIGFTPEQPGMLPGSAFTHYAKSVDALVASGTYEPGVAADSPLTIFNRTRDPSSNQVTFFDISNLFYGDRISPKSLSITDNNMTGSGGAISITLKDNGNGGLYRCDCLTPAATWNNVGNVYYDEGIVLIKSPHLYFFGKDQYQLQFKGERKVHVMNTSVIADRNHINSSSNPNWMALSASSAPADPDPQFVYITGLNFHDENLNVVMKTQLAQPIMKRHRDRLVFRVKYDF
jgi:hypothetical protein